MQFKIQLIFPIYQPGTNYDQIQYLSVNKTFRNKTCSKIMTKNNFTTIILHLLKYEYVIINY